MLFDIIIPTYICYTYLSKFQNSKIHDIYVYRQYLDIESKRTSGNDDHINGNDPNFFPITCEESYWVDCNR